MKKIYLSSESVALLRDYVKGLPGSNIATLRVSQDLMRQSRSSFIVLQIGTNDLDSGSSSLVTADRIITFALN